jgi:predicted acylesterase/phospholipase RssA/CRP-like cAMP-binding protein
MKVGPAATPPPRRESAADFLARVPLFAGLDPSVRESVAARARPVRVASGEWLFREGDPGDGMYVVRAGRLEVIDESAGKVIRELGRGDALGELALITASPRSASVRAARATDLLAVDRDDFEELLTTAPALPIALTRALGQQLRDTRAPISTARPRPTTAALVALDDRVPVADLARQLSTAVGRHLSCALLGGDQAGSPAPSGEPTTVYGALLDRAEADHDLVLLDAGVGTSGGAWNQFCLQQADRILAITSGGQPPETLPAKPELRGCELVAYNVPPGSGALAGLAALLDPVEAHVLRDSALAADVERLARRLSGRSVGVVLSGGGARAFSHIGVLEELDAAGVTIDRVMGVSMGAFVGALYAMGLDADEIDAHCFEEWVQRRPLADYTVPRHALIRGERARAMFQRTFGNLAVEELARSFMAGSGELRSGRLVITRSGPLWEAVGYSMCIPILAPPQVRGRELYIDGSLVDNLPVQEMADLGEGPIIAVDVKTSFERPAAESLPTDRPASSGRPPRLGETLMRVLLLGSADTSEAAHRHAELIIKPRAEGVGLLEFHQLDAAREAGRAAARAALEEAPASLFV